MVAESASQSTSIRSWRIAIVVSRYNESITGKLKTGAVDTCMAFGLDPQQLLVVDVPGAWELPVITARLIKRSDIHGAVALGAVIRGETSHDEHINRAVSLALMNLSVETGKPIGFGLLTCNTVEQAIHRSGGNVGNKGIETAEAVLELLQIQAQVDLL